MNESPKVFNVHDCETGYPQSAVPLTLAEAQEMIKALQAKRPNHPFMIVTI
jgi:hypothetical protein